MNDELVYYCGMETTALRTSRCGSTIERESVVPQRHIRLPATHVVAGLETARNSASPLEAVVDELLRGPLAIGVTSSINLEPLRVGSIEAGARAVAGSHVSGDRAQVIGRPLRR